MARSFGGGARGGLVLQLLPRHTISEIVGPQEFQHRLIRLGEATRAFNIPGQAAVGSVLSFAKVATHCRLPAPVQIRPRNRAGPHAVTSPSGRGYASHEIMSRASLVAPCQRSSADKPFSLRTVRAYKHSRSWMAAAKCGVANLLSDPTTKETN